MGAFFAAHFVAAHQQVGDFEVVDVKGKLIKNGGNVASYFCTPEGRVIHAVTGPVSPETLLAEAAWALEVAAKAREYPASQQPAFVALAHSNVLNGVTPPPAPIRHGGDLAPVAPRDRRIHDLFARRPLPLLGEVYREIFENLLGQEVSDGAANLIAAQRGLKLAEETGRPVLFVIHKRPHNVEFQEEWRRQWGRHLTGRSPLGGLLHRYVVVVLPLEDLPALSQVLGQPPFQAPSQETPLFVVADSAGRQLDEAVGWQAQDVLPNKLARGLVAALKVHTAPVRELRRIARFLENVDQGLALEVIRLIPQANQEAA